MPSKRRPRSSVSARQKPAHHAPKRKRKRSQPLSWWNRLERFFDSIPAPTLEELLERGDDLFARERPTAQAIADLDAGILDDESDEDLDEDDD